MAQTGGTTRIGKYDIVEELGRGGMGVVYRGVDKAIGREVAIKTLTEGFSGDKSMLARFYDEVRITGNLNHPNIVTVYEVGDENGIPYIVMECVKGGPLDKVLLSSEPMPLPDRLRIVQEVCSALGYAHQNNVIHRDIKPANIFVLPDGKAKLLDFGIARLEKRDQDHGHTRTGHLIGTVPYMAPERLRGETLDGRSDIFATGVVLYQLIAGQLPFTGVDTVLMQKIMQEPHPTMASIGVECLPALEMVVDRALAKDPDERYSTAEEMAADLDPVIAELRQGQAQELLAEAKSLVEADQLAHARSVLHSLLKIDSKHAAARDLLAQIQNQLTQRRREATIQQIRQQAEEAFNSKRFDQSLSVLESGLELFAADPELEKLREKAQKEKEKQGRIGELLNQAESARRKGDYKAAITAAQKALAMDTTNPRIVALCNNLSREAEEAERHSKARALLASARGEIGSRRYNQAIELLNQVEQLDPTNPELPLLLGDAKSGLEQVRRREAITHLEEEVAKASSYEQLQQVAQSIQSAIAEMPTESALFRLNAQVERMVREHDNRRLVEDTVLACRDLRPREALELVRQTQLRVPGEERLLSLESLLVERLRQQSSEERRAEYLSRAREALAKQQFSNAVRILEFCEAEGLASGEIMSLLDFARNEEREHKRLDRLRNNLAHAQGLIADSFFEEAVAFLEEALRQNEDPALRMLLDQAAAGRDALHRQIAATLASAGNLLQTGKREEAIQLLQMQPPAVQRSAQVQATLAAIDEERQQAVFRTIGRAYAALDADLPAAEALMRQAQAAAADPAFCTTVAVSFHSRAQSFADSAVSEAVRSSRLLLRDRDKLGAEKLLVSASRSLPYASDGVKHEWEALRRKTGATGVISRFRG